MWYNIWIYFVILPYVLFRYIYKYIIYENQLDELIFNSDYTSIDVKFGIKEQKFIYVNPNKWYYDSNYVYCMNDVRENILKSKICRYNGTHIILDNNYYKYKTYFSGFIYCFPNTPPKIYVKNTCVPVVRLIYELYSTYLFICTILLFYYNFTI